LAGGCRGAAARWRKGDGLAGLALRALPAPRVATTFLALLAGDEGADTSSFSASSSGRDRLREVAGEAAGDELGEK
jgi:hypothetical protein